MSDSKLQKLGDRELLQSLQLAVSGERRATIAVVQRLAEVARRRLHLKQGYPSLYDYCTNKLNYSGSAAGRRIQAARCVHRYPETLALLRTRELTLSSISQIAPILTDDNRDDILRRVRGKTYREVERVLADYRPPVWYRDRVRPVRVLSAPAKDIDEELYSRDIARKVAEMTGIPDFAPGRGNCEQGAPDIGSARKS